MPENDPSNSFLEPEPGANRDFKTRLRSFVSDVEAFIEAKVIPAMDDLAEVLRRLTVKQTAYIGGGVTLFLIVIVIWGTHGRSSKTLVTSTNPRRASTANRPQTVAAQPTAGAQAAVAVAAQPTTQPSSAVADSKLPQTDSSQTVDISTSKDVGQQEDAPADQAQASQQESTPQTTAQQPKPQQASGNDASGGDVPPPPETNGDPGAGGGTDSGSGS